MTHSYSKSGRPDPRLGVTLGGGGVENSTVEFLGYYFIFVLSSDYRPQMHRLVTICERDKPTS